MTDEDKKIVAEYMGWYEVMVEDPMNKGVMEKIITKHNHAEAYFDLNDAGLCVEEMVKRGEWEDFVVFVEETPENRESLITWNQLIAWLFNVDNFFTAFVEWRRSK